MSDGRQAVVAGLITAVILIAPACSGSDPTGPTPTPVTVPPPTATPTPTPVPTPTPTPVPFDAAKTLEESGRVMAGLSTFHFGIRHRGGSTQLLPGFSIDEATGSIERPDKMSVKFSGVFGQSFAFKSSLVAIGQSSFMTNPLSGKWEAAPEGVSPLGFFDPARGIASMMASVERSHLLDDVTGRPEFYRLGGDLAAKALSSLVGTTLEDATVRVELTIDAEGLYMLEAVVDGRVTPTDEEGVVRIITLSAFDEPVSIEPPV